MAGPSTSSTSPSASPVVTNDPSHVEDHSIIFTTMTSITYLSGCVGVIFFLLLVLLLLGALWYWCLRPRTKYNGHTVHYSAVQSDEEVPSKKKRKRYTSPHGSKKYLSPSTHHHKIEQPPLSPRSSRQWGSVPVNPNVDVNAGHLLLSYIEDNLKDKNKLDKEWEQLCLYQPEDDKNTVAQLPSNRHKNRYPDILPYDRNRVKLNSDDSMSGSDYINASYIIDVDPSYPKYIVTQGPMQHTISDFWQMVWEQGINVIVMLTPLTDMGLSQSSQYWASNGSETYHHIEVRLVSEHHHTTDYVVRSFYIFHSKYHKSRTVTQFHYLTWSSAIAPPTIEPLLEFRRKVNVAQSQYSQPLLVHCSEGVGRTGTYCLIDMTLTRVSSSAKEINLAASVEHLRDQRQHMVKTKVQFEVALDALVEETQNMLNAASQRHITH